MLRAAREPTRRALGPWSSLAESRARPANTDGLRLVRTCGFSFAASCKSNKRNLNRLQRRISGITSTALAGQILGKRGTTAAGASVPPLPLPGSLEADAHRPWDWALQQTPTASLHEPRPPVAHRH